MSDTSPVQVTVGEDSQSQTKFSPHRSESLIALKDLPLLQRREFKIQGGQIGDNASDISYSSISKQMDRGVKENHIENEVVQAVLRIIKPGIFKEMLTSKEEMQPRLPVDLIFNLNPDQDPTTPRGYAEKWAARMKEAYRIASENSQQSSAKGKKSYDRHTRGTVLEPEPDADKSENENIEVPAEEVQRETDPEDNDEPAAPLQPADANEGEEDEPEVRRSTRARRPPQMFTYNSLGQPTFQFQPPPAVHAVEAFLPPARTTDPRYGTTATGKPFLRHSGCSWGLFLTSVL
uniref:Uncharacterized protein n=1 Tax=Knipowitschia caucasica TaxID=637954 RepID=A0AAV2J7M6_KNICA